MTAEALREETAAGVEALARWAAEQAATPGGGLPAATRRKAVMVVLDDLAAALAAAGESEVQAAARIGERRGGGTREATLLVTGGRAERGWAAASNAIAVTTPELDEGYRPVTCHGGLYTVPAAVAEAEATGRSLADVLGCVALGYEVATRLARAFPPPFPPILHPHAVFSPVGAATAVALLRGTSAAGLQDVITAAATMAMNGPFGHAMDGSLVRNAWPGAGAWLGFAAVDWAGAGLAGGHASVYEALANAQGGTVSPGRLTEGLGERYAVDDGYHKAYGCCQYAHSAVEAALQVHADSAGEITADRVRRIVLEVHPLAQELDNAAPRGSLAAKFSLPHIAAAVLATGEAGPLAFGASSLRDERIAELRAKAEIVDYGPVPAPPHDRPARVTVEWADGATTTAEVLSARGGADRPLEEADLLDKITAATSQVAPGYTAASRDLLAGTIDPATLWQEVLQRLLSDAAYEASAR
ncbi:MAG: MmgE/PrpD family protein [Streptosporangiales bacterium]